MKFELINHWGLSSWSEVEINFLGFGWFIGGEDYTKEVWITLLGFTFSVTWNINKEKKIEVTGEQATKKRNIPDWDDAPTFTRINRKSLPKDE